MNESIKMSDARFECNFRILSFKIDNSITVLFGRTSANEEEEEQRTYVRTRSELSNTWQWKIASFYFRNNYGVLQLQGILNEWMNERVFVGRQSAGSCSTDFTNQLQLRNPELIL